MFGFFLDQGLQFTLDFVFKYTIYAFIILALILVFVKTVTFLIVTAIDSIRNDDL